MGNSCHGKIHTYLGAFTGEVSSETCENSGINILGNAYNVFGSPGKLILGLGELGTGNLALGAEFGSGVSLVNIAANGAYPFFHNRLLLCFEFFPIILLYDLIVKRIFFFACLYLFFR